MSVTKALDLKAGDTIKDNYGDSYVINKIEDLITKVRLTLINDNKIYHIIRNKQEAVEIKR